MHQGGSGLLLKKEKLPKVRQPLISESSSAQCPFCSLMFGGQAELNEHLSFGIESWSENFSYSCGTCYTKFKSYKGYRQHLGKIHDISPKEFQCTVCPKRFKNKYAVKFHMQQVHFKSTRVKCPRCSKLMYNKYLLPDHLGKCLIRT